MMYHALYASMKNALNRKPPGFQCFNFHDFSVSIMTICCASYHKICWYGSRNLEFLDDFTWTGPFWCWMRGMFQTFWIKMVMIFSFSWTKHIWNHAQRYKNQKKTFIEQVYWTIHRGTLPWPPESPHHSFVCNFARMIDTDSADTPLESL